MNKKINILEIPKEIEYRGYLWMSDSKEPTVLKNAKLLSLSLKISDTNKTLLFDEISDSSNPFIVEGQLYAEKEQKSYSIRYVDGNHIVMEYDLNKIPAGWVSDEKEDMKQFIPNRLEGVAKIKFRQYWEPQPDELCADMKTYVPAAYIFAGFEYNK